MNNINVIKQEACMSHIFISYSHAHKDYKIKLVKRIIQYGFAVWNDEDIEYGDPWWPSIEEAIESCAAFLVIMTPDAEKSKWVRKEIILAQSSDKPIFPFLLQGDIFKILLDTQYVDVRPKPDSNNKLKDIYPPRRFYNRLMQFATRIPRLSSEEFEAEKKKRENYQLVSKEAIPSVVDRSWDANENNQIYDEIRQWEAFRIPGNNDYYGMAMLALALEAVGTYPTHSEAIIHFKRAFKLEHRVIDEAFMNAYHGWTENQFNLVKRIISDKKFW